MPPQCPECWRKSTAFVPRYQKFESISLQRRVCKLLVPVCSGSTGPMPIVQPATRPESGAPVDLES
jgi:hypothetical protein